MKILYYRSPSGASPAERFIESLAKRERAEVFAILREVYASDLTGGLVDYRPIEGKLWELRVGQQRIFCVLLVGPRMVLLHGYKKESQKVPRHEIDVARARMKDVLRGE